MALFFAQEESVFAPEKQYVFALEESLFAPEKQYVFAPEEQYIYSFYEV